MDRSGGYSEYAFVADLYDHVVGYRERQDVAFFVDLARETLDRRCAAWASRQSGYDRDDQSSAHRRD